MRRAYYNEDEQAVYDVQQDIGNLDECFRQIQKDLARLMKILEKYDKDDGNNNNDQFSDSDLCFDGNVLVGDFSQLSKKDILFSYLACR